MEKKLARTLIDKGVDTEFRITLEEADKILSDWKKGSLDNRTAYHNYSKKFRNIIIKLPIAMMIYVVQDIFSRSQLSTKMVK